MKKILITTTTYPLNNKDAQPKFIYYLADKLSKNLDVTVLAPRGKEAKKNEKIGKVDVIRYPYFLSKFETLVYGNGILENLRANRFRYFQIPFLFIAQFVSVWSIVKDKKIDIINAHWIIPQGLVSVILKKTLFRNLRVVVTSHGGDLFGLSSLNNIKKWVLNNADSIIVVSSSMKKHCQDRINVNEQIPIYVRSMGVDLTEMFVQKNDLNDRENLIFVGRIAEKKGLPILIKAMDILHKQGVKACLTVVGDGSALIDIVKLVKSLNLDKYITFKGRIINSEIPAILNKHAIFIMPSVIAVDGDQEGLGLVAVEAMGCGCTVIASDLDAIRDVVKTGETGVLFNSGDEKDLANKIGLIYSNSALRIKYAQVGRRFVLDKFDWSKVTQDYSNIMEV